MILPRFRLAAMVLLALPAGCTVGPKYEAPKMTPPERFVASADGVTTRPSGPATMPVSVRWWESFDDPTLTSLVERAARSNLDLRLATARLREARAARGVARAGLFPTADATGRYTRSRSADVGDLGGFGGGDSETGTYQAGFDASWEIDVFGGTRRAVEAAGADVQSAMADRQDVLLTLVSEVARNYVELRGTQRQISIARQNIDAQQQTLDLTRQRFRAGLAADLDVARAEALVATTRSQVPLLERRARQSVHALSVLLGSEPASLLAELEAPQNVPVPPSGIATGVPSELLRRRPDVRRAERDLAAATARVGVAVADLFPRFTLTGSLGRQGGKVADLTDGGNTFWSFGPGVSWPIFNAGRVRSNIAVQNARLDQVLVRYEQTVLTSLADVENALVAYGREQERRAALSDAVASNARAVDLANQLYAQGLGDFLDVLEAQRSLYQAQDQLVQSDAAISANAVALYKALGGGWESAPEAQARR